MKEEGAFALADVMLAKGKKSVNGKCVLLCTNEEETGRKITIMTVSHGGVHFLTSLYVIETKADKYLTGYAKVLHSNCELEQY